MIDLLGLPTALHATEREGAEALAAVLRCARAVDAAPRVHVRATGEPVSVPSDSPATDGDELTWWRPEPGVAVLRHRSGLTARATDTELTVGGNAPRYRDIFRHVFLNALAQLTGCHDRYLLHGAAFVRRGRAVIVLGGSGAGKSTLALCALRSGWEVLADDAIAVRCSRGELEVAGVPRPLTVPADVLDADRESVSLLGDPRGRRELGPDSLTHGWHPLVGSAVVAHADGARGTVAAIGGQTVFRRVLESWAPGDDGAYRRRIFALAGAVARLSAVEVRLGADVEVRIVDGSSLLARAAPLLGLQP